MDGELRRANSSAKSTPGEPSYFFTIGSVVQFEEKLDATQAALGHAQRDSVTGQ